jgi:superfamily II DNA or RNA helicase
MTLDGQRLAEFVLQEAFETLDLSEEEWLDSVMYGLWAEDRFAEKIRRELNDLRLTVSISQDQIPLFLAMVLGRELLRFGPIRGLIFQGLIKKDKTDGGVLQRYREIEGLQSDRHTVEELISVCQNREWAPSTKFAFEFCQMVGLPPQFAQAGTRSGLPPIVYSEPYESLPPLLDFQEIVKERVIKSLSTSSTAYVIMPTGSGKTRTSVEAVIGFLNDNNSPIDRVLWIADRTELCEQGVESFLRILPHRQDERVQITRFWSGNTIDLDIDSEGNRFIPGITVTSTQQLRNRIDSGDPIGQYLVDNSRIVIIDEVHRNLDFNTLLIDRINRKNSNCGIIGLTATPSRRLRFETGKLVRLFDTPITPIENNTVDIDQIRKSLEGRKILAKQVDVSASDVGLELSPGPTPITKIKEGFEIIIRFLQTGSKSILVFTESVEQSRRITSALVMHGVAAYHLDSETPPGDRRQIIEDYKSGNLQVLLNYDILTTGFDAPLTDTVIILRGTEDYDQPLIQQMIGRGLRGPKFGGTEKCKVFIRGN